MGLLAVFCAHATTSAAAENPETGHNGSHGSDTGKGAVRVAVALIGYSRQRIGRRFFEGQRRFNRRKSHFQIVHDLAAFGLLRKHLAGRAGQCRVVAHLQPGLVFQKLAFSAISFFQRLCTLGRVDFFFGLFAGFTEGQKLLGKFVLLLGHAGELVGDRAKAIDQRIADAAAGIADFGQAVQHFVIAAIGQIFANIQLLVQ